MNVFNHDIEIPSEWQRVLIAPFFCLPFHRPLSDILSRSDG
ncbi:hypothetical protein [Chryseobacterium rhizosphaerae]